MIKNIKTALILILIVVVMTVLPFAVARGAEFSGTDDAGSQMVNEIRGEEYEPWFTPPLETALGGELPGEIESLLFCLQTGIGVGILAFGFGYYTARKKYAPDSDS
ncbi:cobalt ABC transporter [Gemmiger sp. An120]|uniref:energy-coupling factor ABC transporter substrate-binding protein n=1 Tax=Gemmiger TaxID=204475 RepID=UPI000B391A94|nr:MULTISPECIES: cobalt transport protein CbiN [Gemmiger]MBM6914052.1 cobalt transport protein CbiN [Gemmiger formicilis]OUQ42052.1 cobalt ABC transporter [Gemmiger sp. An120]